MEAALDQPVLGRPYAAGSDWYAFAVMVMQSLVCVGPYGGVYRPADKAAPAPTAPQAGAADCTKRTKHYKK